MSIDLTELIEFHNECEYLDFKKEEYNEQNKPNLIKDVLSFANADAEQDRYIIMGVEKIDGKVILHNISAKYDAANIQQYIHNNITPDLNISYYPFEHQDHQLLILRISNPNSQPYMTSKQVSFKEGRLLLKENECWVRKGSFQRTASRMDFDKMYQRTSKKESAKQVVVSFGDESTMLEASPKFIEQTTHYRLRPDGRTRELGLFIPNYNLIHSYGRDMVNESYICFEIRIHNTGLAAIEDYKLNFNLSDPVQDINDTNVEKSRIPMLLSNKYIRTTFLYNDTASGKLVPRTNVLVGDDVFRSEDIYIKPFPNEHVLLIKWKLISKDYQQEGTLRINVKPLFQQRSETEYVKFSDQVRTEGPSIVDCIDDAILEDE